MRMRCSWIVIGVLAPSLLDGETNWLRTQTINQMASAGQSGAAKPSVPDLSGVWEIPRGVRAGYRNPGYSVTAEKPSMTPWGEERYRLARDGPKRNQFDRGNENRDPSYIHCLPFGPTRNFTHNQPFEIVQTPKIVYILFQTAHEVRRAYMDGRPHPEDWPFRWNGHSTGKYEGDTLVIDTVHLNDTTWIDTFGYPHSDALHIVERIRRVEPGTLQVDFLFEDPKAYTKPWAGKRVFQEMTGPHAEILEDINCETHLLDEHLPKVLRGDPEP